MRKLLLVVTITVLIWAWAERALDDRLSAPATMYINESANPDLWVSFNKTPSVPIQVQLTGPASKIDEVNRKLKDRSTKLEFYFNAAQEKIATPGVHTLYLLPVLQKEKKIRQLGLKVESCQPDTLRLEIAKLIRQKLTVICLDENQIPISLKRIESIEPSQIDMLVPENWQGRSAKTNVLLTAQQIEQAAVAAIEVTPYIELAPTQRRYADKPVKIKMHPIEERLQEYRIPAIIKFAFSPNLQGKYKVQLENEDEVMSSFNIKATAEAKSAYQTQSLKMTLEIDDSDAKAAELITREIIYNFPERYVRNDEIRLNQQPLKARFKLIPISAPPRQPAAVP